MASFVLLPAKSPKLNPPARSCKHALPGSGRKYLVVLAEKGALKPSQIGAGIVLARAA
jgi:hypothetical protein